MNCVDVRLVRGRLTIGYLEAHVAAHISPLMHDLPVNVLGLGLARVSGQLDVA